MEDSEPERKRRFWNVDPEVFRAGRRRGLPEILKDRAKSFARLVGFTLLLAYAPLITILGIIYGGLVFWSTLAGSLLVIGIVLQRLGYGRRFESWNPSLLRQLAALTLAFIGIAAIYLDLFWLRLGILPILIVLLLAVPAIFLRRFLRR